MCNTIIIPHSSNQIIVPDVVVAVVLAVVLA